MKSLNCDISPPVAPSTGQRTLRRHKNRPRMTVGLQSERTRAIHRGFTLAWGSAVAIKGWTWSAVHTRCLSTTLLFTSPMSGFNVMAYPCCKISALVKRDVKVSGALRMNFEVK